MKAALSIDMDNQWSYMKTHGDAGWESYPSYFNVLIPYLIELLDELDLKMTFFLVGKDVEKYENKKYIELITQNDHEPGNHSYTHEPWLHLYPKEQIIEELSKTQNLIKEVTGVLPNGFRGPGFSWSKELLEVLIDLDINYDASTLPTYIGPLARMYYFWTSKLDKEEREQRKKLFGTVKDGLRPDKPYWWLLPNENRLLELPVTTIPFFKTPFHLSYLLYLSGYSEKLMDFYLSIALGMCKLTGTPISFLIHPLDVLGGDQVPELKFFPGMNIDADTKRKRFIKVIYRLKKNFELVNMSQLSNCIKKSDLKRTIKVK